MANPLICLCKLPPLMTYALWTRNANANITSPLDQPTSQDQPAAESKGTPMPGAEDEV